MAPPEGYDKSETEQTSLLTRRQYDHDQGVFVVTGGGLDEDSEGTRMTDPEYQAVGFGSSNKLLEEDTLPPPPPPNKSLCWPTFDRDAVHFGARLSFLLTIGSLFVVVRGVGYEWPEGQWVVITVLFVSWFPRLDAASVIEKSIQRIIGTLLGGFMGLVCGSLSLKIPNASGPNVARNQAICIEICFASVTFMFCFLSTQLKIGRTTRLVDRYNYATILCNLTFIISIFPFYQYESKDPYMTSGYRVLNVTIGCLLSALGAMVVLPRSANEILHKRIQKQCRLAGEASEAVLHAASDIFQKTTKPSLSIRMQHLRKESRTSFRRLNKAILDEGRDISLDKYEVALQDWKVTKGLFSLLQYDPFQYLSPPSQQDSDRRAEFRSNCADTLARALEIQTAVVLMDGIIRNEPPHGFDDDGVALFAALGTLTRKLFAIVPGEDVKGSKLIKEQLMDQLSSVHDLICQMTMSVATSTSPKTVAVTRAASRRCAGRSSLLFLELVEHLILHCLSLYDHWMEVEDVVAASPKLTRAVSLSV